MPIVTTAKIRMQHRGIKTEGEKMSLEKITRHSFEEMKTHVIDKALFGVKDKIIAVVSWIDLTKAKLSIDYSGLLQFISRYIVSAGKTNVESVATTMPSG